METPKNRIYEFRGFRLDTGKRLLKDGSESTVALMPKVFDTLVFLVENAGTVVSKDELLAAIWPDTIVEENNLTQNISSLRRTFGEKPGEHRFISTIPGRGYKFVAEVICPEEIATAGTAEIPNAFAEPVPTLDPPEHSGLDHGPTTASSAGWDAYRKSLAVAGIVVVGAAIVLGVYLAGSNGPAAAAPVRSIAVLPFSNSGGIPDTEYLSDGIAENVINALSRITDLKVLARNSTFRFRQDQSDIRSIGTQLDVDAVVTGDVRQLGQEFAGDFTSSG
jgi:DNA-binding winged helix-turn-helix (wHTH) protein